MKEKRKEIPIKSELFAFYDRQQPGMQPQTPPSQSRGGRSGAGGSSSGGRRSSESNRGRSRYNPY